jgi:chemotaxis protein methyltransferase CheR
MLSPASYQFLRFEGRPGTRPAGEVAPPVATDAPDAARAPGRPSARTARAPRVEPELSPEEQRLLDAAFDRAGLDAAAYRTGPFRRRMPAVLRAIRAPSADQAAARLAAQPALAERALDALLIGHTEPFRDADTFQDLRRRVLPELATGGRGLRVWSVGCSGGVELLSAALLLDELGVLQKSTLRGSDIRAGAIAIARSGSVLQLMATLPDQFNDLRPRIARAEFGAAIASAGWVNENALTADTAESAWDVVFCRNLAIYLDAQSSQRLWSRLVAALVPGGVLVTGRAERPPASLPLARLAKCIYRLEGGAT